jgi:hypothetical protein
LLEQSSAQSRGILYSSVCVFQMRLERPFGLRGGIGGVRRELVGVELRVSESSPVALGGSRDEGISTAIRRCRARWEVCGRGHVCLLHRYVEWNIKRRGRELERSVGSSEACSVGSARKCACPQQRMKCPPRRAGGSSPDAHEERIARAVVVGRRQGGSPCLQREAQGGAVHALNPNLQLARADWRRESEWTKKKENVVSVKVERGRRLRCPRRVYDLRRGHHVWGRAYGVHNAC